MNLHPFLTWPYLIFLVPGGLAVVLLLLSALGADNSDSQTAADTDVDADADVDSDTDVVGHTDHPGGPATGALHFLGADKAPLTLVTGAFLLGWGFAGFWANQLLLPVFHSLMPTVAAAIVIAAILGVCTARGTAAISERIVPKNVTAAISQASLVGQEASVVYPISTSAGRAFYYDKNAVLHDVSCRVRPDEEPIAKGRKVILSGYDPQTGRFWAEPSPFEE